MTYTKADAVAAMESVCSGTVAVPDYSPYETYAGNVSYKLASGWTVVVFNDCAEWDYVDSVIAPDGTVFDGFPEGQDIEQDIAFWRPTCASADDGCDHYGHFDRRS